MVDDKPRTIPTTVATDNPMARAHYLCCTPTAPADPFERRLWHALQRARSAVVEWRWVRSESRLNGLIIEGVCRVESASQSGVWHVCESYHDKRCGRVEVHCDCIAYGHHGVCRHQFIAARSIRQERALLATLLADHLTRVAA